MIKVFVVFTQHFIHCSNHWNAIPMSTVNEKIRLSIVSHQSYLNWKVWLDIRKLNFCFLVEILSRLHMHVEQISMFECEHVLCHPSCCIAPSNCFKISFCIYIYLLRSKDIFRDYVHLQRSIKRLKTVKHKPFN